MMERDEKKWQLKQRDFALGRQKRRFLRFSAIFVFGAPPQGGDETNEPHLKDSPHFTIETWNGENGKEIGPIEEAAE